MAQIHKRFSDEQAKDLFKRYARNEVEREYLQKTLVEFCLRLQRTADAYRQVSINNIPVKVNGVDPYQSLTIRIYPLNPVVSELRFWHESQLVDTQTFKNQDLKGVFTFNS